MSAEAMSATEMMNSPRPQVMRTNMGYVTLEITGKHYVLFMLAIIGYIPLEITGKLPGLLSPSAGLADNMGYVTLEITGKNFEPKYRQGFAMKHVLYMLAIMRYISLEITGEVPGVLSRPQILRTTMGYITLEITGKNFEPKYKHDFAMHHGLFMLAIMGYINLEITGEVSGFLSARSCI